MKVSTLRNKLVNINRQLAQNISRLYDLAEEFDDPEFSDLLTDYAEKLDALVNTDEDPDTSASVLLDYIDNELTYKDTKED